MNAKISELTPDQIAMIPVIRDEWLAHGLSTEPANRSEAERGVRDAYREAGLAAPSIVIWLDSPLAGAIGSWILTQVPDQIWCQIPDRAKNLVQAGDQITGQFRSQFLDLFRSQVWSQITDQVGNQVTDQVGNQVGNQVTDQVGNQVADQVRGQLRGQLRGQQVADQVANQVADQVANQVADQVRDQVRGQLRGQQIGDQVTDQVGGQVTDLVWSQLRDQVGNQPWTQVWFQVGGQVWGQVWGQIENQVLGQLLGQLRGQVRNQVNKACWGQHDAGWLSFYDYFRRAFGLSCCDRLDGLSRVGRNAGWWWPMRDAVVLTERPTTLRRDAQTRLHAEDGPALLYPDGFGIWAWHGVRVPRELIEGTWSTSDILREGNVEVRRCAIEKMGWDRFVSEADLHQVGTTVPDPGNSGHFLSLYDVPEAIYDEPVRVLLCDNATPERDGTRRRFGLTVPASVNNPIEAAAWTFDVKPADYAQLTHAY